MARRKIKLRRGLTRFQKFTLLIAAWVLLLISATEIYLAVARKRIVVEDILVKKAKATTDFQECLDNGFAVLELFPRQCKTPDGKMFTEQEREIPNECNGMKIDDAYMIARNGDCGVSLGSEFFCNEGTETWWIDLDMEKNGCNPACVVDTVTELTDINWRCTGLTP